MGCKRGRVRALGVRTIAAWTRFRKRSDSTNACRSSREALSTKPSICSKISCDAISKMKETDKDNNLAEQLLMSFKRTEGQRGTNKVSEGRRVKWYETMTSKVDGLTRETEQSSKSKSNSGGTRTTKKVGWGSQGQNRFPP